VLLGFWEFVALCFAPNRAPLVVLLVAADKTPTNDLRTASKPRCAGPSDGAGGSVVVGLDPDAGLIADLLVAALLALAPA
jgi:hypothetical protein